MILPTSYVWGLILLLISFLCLGSWVITFKLTGTRWRFELFYLDFAVGALALAVIAAFTLGSLGSDLAFSDRMLVAGRTAQAILIVAGSVFNLGNMLLLAASSLLGVSAAFPLSVGLALIVGSCFNFRPANVLPLTAGIILMLAAVIFDGTACRLRDLVLPKGPVPKPRTGAKPSRVQPKMKRTTKGLIVAVIGGIMLGVFYPVAANGLQGDFGLGPYAGVLMFSIGVLLSTVMFNFYFLNIAIEGEPLSFNAYFKGQPSQHFLGFAGGALCVGGILATSLGNSVPRQAGIQPALGFILPVASVLLAMFWGALVWKEFASAPRNAKIFLAVTAVFFVGSIILVGVGITS